MFNIAPFAFAFECGLIVLAALLGWWCEHSPLASCARGDDAWLGNLRACGLGVVAAVPPLVGLAWMTRTRSGPARRLVDLVDQQVVPMFDGASVVEFALIALAAGVGEELLFRGLMQALIVEWCGPPAGVAIAIGLTSLVFALLHALSPAYATLALAMSVYLGLLQHYSGNVLAPIVTHAAYDFVAIWYLVRRGK